MKLSRTDLFWGIALVIIGIGFGGEALELWNFEVFFSGWWTLFIIVPCLISLVESGVKRSNTIGLSIGGLLLLSSWHVIAEDLIVPLLLVIIGVILIFIRPRSVEGESSDDELD